MEDHIGMPQRPLITSMDRANYLADEIFIRRRPGQAASKEIPFNPYNLPRDVFERIDTDQNGELDRAELVAKLLSVPGPESAARFLRNGPIDDLLYRDDPPLTARQLADRHAAELAEADKKAEARAKEAEAAADRVRPRTVGQTAQGDPLISVGPISITAHGTEYREILTALHERRKAQASNGGESIFVETAQGYVEARAAAFDVPGGALPRFGDVLSLLPPTGQKIEGKVIGVSRRAQVGVSPNPSPNAATEPIVINITPPQAPSQNPSVIVAPADRSYLDQRAKAKDAADFTNTILEGLGDYFRNLPGGG